MFFVAKICKRALRASIEGYLAVAASTPTYSSLLPTDNLLEFMVYGFSFSPKWKLNQIPPNLVEHLVETLDIHGKCSGVCEMKWFSSIFTEWP